MAQRASGYDRRPDEAYYSPPWLAASVAPFLRSIGAYKLWEPAVGSGGFASALEEQGFDVVATNGDFFSFTDPPLDIDALVTNPPYGVDRRSDLACRFINHALAFDDLRAVILLLRIDFDSAKTRARIFRDCPTFAGKITLLDRIKWFPGESGPSDNHAFFVWDRSHSGLPWIRYALNQEKIPKGGPCG